MSRTKKETKTCGECKHFKNCRLNNYKDFPACGAFARPTNFDRITASPEALAKFIDKKISLTLDLDECPFMALCEAGVECEECITKWLKQEAGEENDNCQM